MRLAIACAAACLAGGTVQESTDLSFHPAEGSILKKTFEVESSGWIDAIWWDGQDVTSALGSAGITTGITAEARMQVTDEYLRVGDNRPLELLRGFDALRTVWAARPANRDVINKTRNKRDMISLLGEWNHETTTADDLVSTLSPETGKPIHKPGFCDAPDGTLSFYSYYSSLNVRILSKFDTLPDGR